MPDFAIAMLLTEISAHLQALDQAAADHSISQKDRPTITRCLDLIESIHSLQADTLEFHKGAPSAREEGD